MSYCLHWSVFCTFKCCGTSSSNSAYDTWLLLSVLLFVLFFHSSGVIKPRQQYSCCYSLQMSSPWGTTVGFALFCEQEDAWSATKGIQLSGLCFTSVTECSLPKGHREEEGNEESSWSEFQPHPAVGETVKVSRFCRPCCWGNESSLTAVISVLAPNYLWGLGLYLLFLTEASDKRAARAEEAWADSVQQVSRVMLLGTRSTVRLGLSWCVLSKFAGISLLQLCRIAFKERVPV